MTRPGVYVGYPPSFFAARGGCGNLGARSRTGCRNHDVRRKSSRRPAIGFTHVTTTRASATPTEREQQPRSDHGSECDYRPSATVSALSRARFLDHPRVNVVVDFRGVWRRLDRAHNVLG